MKTLYLHIGTPKTATTYLQQFLFVNADRLMKDGIYYPSDVDKMYFPPYVNMHVPLVSSITGLKVNWLSPKYHYPSGEALEQLLEDIENNESNKVLLSSEVFYDAFTTEELINNVKKAFENYQTNIIVYLRKGRTVFFFHISRKLVKVVFILPLIWIN